MQKFVTSITTEFGEPVVASIGAADAGKIVALDETGKIDKSILPMQSILPAGVVQYFARQTAPEGWLIADGGAVSRSEFTDLFEAIGTVFGVGDGSTTFNLPDLRGEFIRGYDDGRGADSNRIFGSTQAGTTINTRLGNANGCALSYADNYGTVNDITAPYLTASLDGSHTGYKGTTRPRNVALLACIKY